MGLFSSNKNLCPICGSPTPRILPTKIDGMPICKKCDEKVEIPIEQINSMSLDEFRGYLECYEANQELREAFQESYNYGGGLFGGGLSFDMEHKLLRLNGKKKGFALKGEELVSFRILEDDRPLFEGKVEGLKCFESDIDKRLDRLEPEIRHFNERMRDFERMENFNRLTDAITGDDDDDNLRNNRFRPIFNIDEPIGKFYVEMDFSHPYIPSFVYDEAAPLFDNEQPSILTYKNSYDTAVADLRELADNLMNLIAPFAPVTEVGSVKAGTASAANVQAAAPVDAVEEIKKYKGLLDAGIITEEEFAAKKRQLMGI